MIVKKVLAYYLTFLLLLSAIHISLAEEKKPEILTSGDWEYKLLEDDTVEIHNYLGKYDVVRVPNELDGKKVISVGRLAFNFCESITEVIIPDGVVSIQLAAFKNCTSLVSVSIPETVEIISNMAFMSCEALQDIIIPSGVLSIGAMAFGCCSSLERVYFSYSVQSIGDRVFVDCYQLKEIIVSPDNPYFASIDGVLFEKQEKKLIYYPHGIKAERYDIPSGVKIIEDRAFFEISGLSTVTIPDSVLSIGEYAFYWSNTLKSIIIPNSVVSIGEKAFDLCDNLILVVSKGSYAAQYCRENSLHYTYLESTDWLNN